MNSKLIRDVFVSGLSHIEIIGGGCARFVCYTNRTDPETDKVIQEVSASIVMPIDQLPDAIRKALHVAGGEAVGVVKKFLPASLLH